MSKTSRLLEGAGLGAALMYFFDPASGRRRRALIQGKLDHLSHLVEEGSQAAADDFGNRVEGARAQFGELFSREPEDDVVLIERVRAHVGRLSCHPGAIFVTANNGQVTLTGPILRDEVGRVVHGVSRVRGVRGVVNQLQVHDTPGDVPGLQGECHPAGEPRSILESAWSPTARFGAIAGGVLLAFYGLGRRDLLSTPLTVLGGALAVRGISNIDLRRLFGIGEAPVTFEAHKIIDVPGPIDEVYDILSHPENFPRFMSHIESATAVEPDRICWTVKGPLGIPIRFETVVSRDQPGKLISWYTVPNSLIPQVGRVLLQPTPTGTRVDVLISYQPPAGEFTKLLAQFFGVSPEQALNDDMVRFKSLLMNGKTTAHGETITLQTVDELDRQASASNAPRQR